MLCLPCQARSIGVSFVLVVGWCESHGRTPAACPLPPVTPLMSGYLQLCVGHACAILGRAKPFGTMLRRLGLRRDLGLCQTVIYLQLCVDHACVIWAVPSHSAAPGMTGGRQHVPQGLCVCVCLFVCVCVGTPRGRWWVFLGVSSFTRSGWPSGIPCGLL